MANGSRRRAGFRPPASLQITFVLPGRDLVIFRGGLFTEGEPSEAWDAASFIETVIDTVAAEAKA